MTYHGDGHAFHFTGNDGTDNRFNRAQKSAIRHKSVRGSNQARLIADLSGFQLSNHFIS